MERPPYIEQLRAPLPEPVDTDPRHVFTLPRPYTAPAPVETKQDHGTHAVSRVPLSAFRAVHAYLHGRGLDVTYDAGEAACPVTRIVAGAAGETDLFGHPEHWVDIVVHETDAGLLFESELLIMRDELALRAKYGDKFLEAATYTLHVRVMHLRDAGDVLLDETQVEPVTVQFVQPWNEMTQCNLRALKRFDGLYPFAEYVYAELEGMHAVSLVVFDTRLTAEDRGFILSVPDMAHGSARGPSTSRSYRYFMPYAKRGTGERVCDAAFLRVLLAIDAVQRETTVQLRAMKRLTPVPPRAAPTSWATPVPESTGAGGAAAAAPASNQEFLDACEEKDVRELIASLENSVLY